jgi:hypothetical protein
MADIEFVDPPPASRGNRATSRHNEIDNALRARPGEWARVMTGVAANGSSYIRYARTLAYAPAGSFEARAVKNGERHDIYARYVGENGEHR